MVFCRTLALLNKVKLPVKKLESRRSWAQTRFVDRLRLTAQAGSGGSGLPKINGIGGAGGCVYIECEDGIDLVDVMRKYPNRRPKGGNGGHSVSYHLLGRFGTDAVVKVPPGILVMDDNKRVLGDLTKAGEKILVARGGEGGNPLNGFKGRKGEHLNLTLYLKLIANIGFVGYPNAGKSTLLRALSRARPQVANYPFTTIRPNIGVIEYPDFRRISCADLPGLIEGAHQNRGLGHNFLRHVERTMMLLFIVDIGGFRLNESAPFRTAFETVMSLNKELELYRADLLDKPTILVVNKLDIENADQMFEELKANMASDEAYENLPEEIKPRTRIEFKETIGIVARDVENISTLKDQLRRSLDDLYNSERQASDLERKRISLPELKDQLV